MPVVMVSSLTEHGADVTLRALELGAVDFVKKPALDVSTGLQDYAAEIVHKVKIASRARVRALVTERRSGAESAAMHLARRRTSDKIIAIGASTGGTEAIREILQMLPVDSPAVLIAQHIPAAFSGRFAERLNSLCALNVSEAQDGVQLLRSHAYVAPGNAHLTLHRDGARYSARLSDAAPVNLHRPSVDVMFDSIANNCGPNAIGVILTGMGNDGARGLKRMHSAGAHTIAQDENSSVIWGMPGEAVKLGAASDIVPLHKIAAALNQSLR
jgi:two-component system chemotaxis response regulator CheB